MDLNPNVYDIKKEFSFSLRYLKGKLMVKIAIYFIIR